MAAHVKCCAGQAGYSLIFDQSVINYQENFNKIGDLSFSIYNDFETTTGSAIYYDAKMFVVVSYCMIVAFHAELKMLRLVIYRLLVEICSLAYLGQVKNDFLSYWYHSEKTRQQFEDCTLSAFNKSKNTALSQLFIVKLKFVCDALKNGLLSTLKKSRLMRSKSLTF